jgi:opacity protein-like surface antigen
LIIYYYLILVYRINVNNTIGSTPMKKNVLYASVLALVLGGVVTSPATAAPYAEIGLGGALPFEHDLKNEISPDAELSYKNAFAITGAVGYAFNNGFRVDAEYGYHAPDFDKLTGHILGFPVEFSGTDGAHLAVNTFTANGYYDIATGTRLTPFVGGGLGLGYIHADATGPNILSDDDAVVLAYQATAGASYALNDHFALTASYRYLGTTEGTFKTTITDGVNSVTGDAKASYSANVLRAGVRYTF